MGNLNSTTVFISDNCLWDNFLKLFPPSTEKKQMAGLGIGVGSMKTGERALLHVGWELGYGKEVFHSQMSLQWQTWFMKLNLLDSMMSKR
jgi:hypothetical protein